MISGYTNIPRVLVVSAAPFSNGDATGITLSNLFAGWPSEKLAQIHGTVLPAESSVCVNSYSFSNEQSGVVRAIKSLRARMSGMRSDPERSAATSHGIAGGAAKGSALASFADGVPFRLSQDLIDWVAKFDPQVIYSPLGSIRMMNAVLQLSERFDIPVVPHFMDDWPSTVYASSARYFPLRCMLRNNLRKVLSRAPFGLTICDDMSEEYARRHDMRFEAFMNCVDIVEQPVAEVRRTGGQVVFGYVGGLHLNRWKSMRDVATALQGVKNEGWDVWLDIFAPESDIRAYRDQFDGFTVVRNLGSLGYSGVREQLRECDVLVHVESFMPEDSLYTRLSISTKVPQYMAEGRPILAYGPVSLSSIAYIDRNRAGIAVARNDDPQALLCAVRALVEQPELREKLGKAGRDTASRSHDAIRERSRLAELLAIAVRSAPVSP